MRRLLVFLAAIALIWLSFESVRQATKPRPAVESVLRSQSTAVPIAPQPRMQHAWFTDISDQVHLDFQQAVGPLGTYFMPEINGSGGAVWDYDNDGDLDLFLVNMGKSPSAKRDFSSDVRTSHRLYRRQRDGTYSDQTRAVGLEDSKRNDVPQLGIGCAIGDANNDGYQDLYLTNYGPDQLFLNRQGERLEDVTHSSGLGCSEWGTAAAFFDYDRDGLLDLMVVNYCKDDRYGHAIACGFVDGSVSYCGPQKFEPTVDRLYHNDGVRDGVPQFSDVTERSGLSKVTTYGLGLAICDFDNDTWPDMFVASDMRENRLWMNNHDGTFREEATLRGCALSGEGMMQGCMGVAVGDVDQDLDFDLVVTNLVTEGSTLYINDGSGMFSDQSRTWQVSQGTVRHTGWGTALVDLDLDGHLDMPAVNGFVVPGGSIFPPHGEDQFQRQTVDVTDPQIFLAPYFDGNTLLLGTSNRKLEDQTINAGSFAGGGDSYRSLIPGDVDADGDIDLVTTAVGGRARLFRNDFQHAGRWLKLSCRLGDYNRDAIGAVIRLRSGNKQWLGQVAPSTSYLASADPTVHFGLGKVEQVEAIEVTWPDGTVETFPGASTNQLIVLTKGRANQN